jgi:hypothetical protein
MKIIITESQLKNKVHNLIKSEGWYETCEILGLDPQELVELFFNDNPMEFLHLYDDLTEVHYEKGLYDYILYRDSDGETIMVFENTPRYPWLSIHQRVIVEPLRAFKQTSSYDKIRRLLKPWLKSVYNIDLPTENDMEFRNLKSTEFNWLKDVPNN